MSIGQRVIAKVVNKLGGVDTAAATLGISASLLLCFLEGTRSVPDTLLLRAVDYVLDEFPELPVTLKGRDENLPKPHA